MLLVKTYTGPDSFGGTGLFADEFIPAGTLTWDYSSSVDTFYSVADYKALPTATRNAISKHVFPYFLNNSWGILCSGDNDRYTNHSFDPNFGDINEHQTVALRDINKGEEITANYSDFVPPSLSDDLLKDLPLVVFLRQMEAERQKTVQTAG